MRALSTKRWATAGVALLLASWGCSSDTEIAEPSSNVELQADANAFHERDFVRTPDLRAALGASVMLDLEAAGSAPGEDTGAIGSDVIRYGVSRSESVRFCLQDVGTALAEVVLRDAAGTTMLRVAPGAECATATLEPGAYEATLTRGPGANAGQSESFFVHASAATDTIEPQCTAEQLTQDPLEGTRDDLWELLAPRQLLQGRPALRLVDDRERFDPAQGFRLSRGEDLDIRIAASDDRVVAPGGQGFMELYAPPHNNTRVTWKMTPVPDGAPWTYTIRAKSSSALVPVWTKYAPSALNWIYYPNNPSFEILRVTLGMRFVPRGEAIQALKSGEVALFEGCNYTGRAWVLNETNAFPRQMANIVGFVQPRSVKLGCNTTLLTYPAVGSTANETRIGQSVTCDAFPSPVAVASVVKTRQITIERKTCTNCDLRKVDLRGLDLSTLKITGGSLEKARFDRAVLKNAAFERVDLTRATFDDAVMDDVVLRGTAAAPLIASSASFVRAKLPRAIVSDANLESAVLTDAVLDDAKLTSVSFDQAVLDRASLLRAEMRDLGLTHTDLRLVTMSDVPGFALLPGESLPANPCLEPRKASLALSRLDGTAVRYAQLPLAVWKYLDFTGSSVDLSAVPIASRKLENQNLCGLRLGGFNFDRFKLGQSKLMRADLTRAAFTNVDLSYARLDFAVLNRATLQYSDLTGAVLDDVVADSDPTTGATLDGTLFAPASLARAHFTRVQMNGATVKMPAGQAHEGALFDGGFFDGTDFTGSDLTGLSMVGGTFTRAIFTRALLDKAKLGKGSRQSVFKLAVLCGAHVRGADFTGAVLTDALFPTADTTLPDLDADGGAPVTCAAVDLGGASSLNDAVTSTDATCPNSVTPVIGSGCKDGQWTPQNEVTRPVCPQRDGGIGPAKIAACYPCASNCQCATQHCSGGTCAGCRDAGL